MINQCEHLITTDARVQIEDKVFRVAFCNEKECMYKARLCSFKLQNEQIKPFCMGAITGV